MPHLSRTCDDANPMLRVESQGESMPRLPYVCRPIVLAVVLAVTATAPNHATTQGITTGSNLSDLTTGQ